MNKFKVGDVVKVIKDHNGCCLIGAKGTIINITDYYRFEEINVYINFNPWNCGNRFVWGFLEDCLEFEKQRVIL